jgi:acetyl-CoA acetyltransferase
LVDAGIQWQDIQIGYCSSSNLHGGAGHTIARLMGATGITMTNVENASAGGCAAFREAYLAVASGMHDIAIAIGVDKLRAYRRDTSQTGEEATKASVNTIMMQGFADRALRHMDQYGTTIDQLAQVSVKNHFNGSINPYAHFQKAVTLEEVYAARMVANPLTVLHCCPWDEGAAAVILCAANVLRRFTNRTCPKVLASICTGAITDIDPLIGLTERASRKAYDMAGISANDLDIIELHDAATIEEIIYYEALGLCKKGEGGRLIESGSTCIQGNIPVNTSGGLISMGHPIGPTGIGQIAEILWQMRGQAGNRNIQKKPKIGMAHMVGAWEVCFIHILGI